MPRITLDGRAIEVEPGTTILQAARRLGVEIPTMCSDGRPAGRGARSADGPPASCFLCVVEVEGKGHLVPACTAPVEEGMVVTTRSEEVHEARRAALELLLSDHAGDCLAPCTLACPAGLDVPGMLSRLARGDRPGAARIARAGLVLPAALGHVCPRFCERTCRRRQVDEPVAVRALHRLAGEWASAFPAPHERDRPPRAAPAGGGRVAAVGPGPARPAAPLHLLRRGHAATILDARDEPGGRLRYAVPPFRLPRAVLAAEVAAVRRLEAEFRLRCRLGEDVSLSDLRGEFDAVILALGAQVPGGLSCPGGEEALPALDLLERVARGEAPTLTGPVVVAGTGDTAIDAARTAIRSGADEVRILWPGREPTAPPLRRRLDRARAEGVRVHYRARPVRLERAGGGTLVLVAEGPSGPLRLEARSVLAASRRSVDAALIARLGLSVGRSGVSVDRASLATGLEGVFAAGEVVSGPGYAVRAIASGARAAAAVHRYLHGEAPAEPRRVAVRMHGVDEEERRRLLSVAVPADGRPPGEVSLRDGEPALAEEEAPAEARRCLQCACAKRDACLLRRYAAEYGADPRAYPGSRRRFLRDDSHPEVVFEPGKCIQCGLCVRIAEAAREEHGLTFIGRGFEVRTAVPFDGPLAAALRVAARECAEACPTGAIALRPGGAACPAAPGGGEAGDPEDPATEVKDGNGTTGAGDAQAG